MASRSLDDLHPQVAAKARAFKTACAAAGIDVLIYCTYRPTAEQDALYAQGRIKPGKIVTNARGGESFHNYGLAFDVCPMRGGKPVWSTAAPADAALYLRMGEIGESVGLEWAGRWKGKLRESVHFQFSGGKPLAHFRSGGAL